jgi:hypothetical protein
LKNCKKYKKEKSAINYRVVWLATSTLHSIVSCATPLFCHAIVNNRRGCGVWRSSPPPTPTTIGCAELIVFSAIPMFYHATINDRRGCGV